MTLAGYTACPKCGGPLDSGFNCTRCSWSSIASSQTTQRIASPAAPRAPDAPRDDKLRKAVEAEVAYIDSIIKEGAIGERIAAAACSSIGNLRAALAASRSQPAAPDEEAKLVAFFRSAEGEELGRQGDHDNLSPAETAIRAMRGVSRGAATEAPDADTERLNWLARQAGAVMASEDGKTVVRVAKVSFRDSTDCSIVTNGDWTPNASGDSLREAIDAARGSVAPTGRASNDYPEGDPVRDECVNCGQPVDSRKQMWKRDKNDVAHVICPSADGSNG